VTKEYILDFLRTHKEEFQHKYQVESIGLFGSYARDEAKDSSDIDILVDMPSKFDLYYDFKEYLEDTFKKNVDLGMKKSMRPLIALSLKKDLIYV
jgi:predicted nucleotidyltransferase